MWLVAEIIRRLVEQRGMQVPLVALGVMLVSFLVQVAGHNLAEPLEAENLFHGFIGAPFLELVTVLMKLDKGLGGSEARFWRVFGDASVTSVLFGCERCSSRGSGADVFDDADEIRRRVIKSMEVKNKKT